MSVETAETREGEREAIQAALRELVQRQKQVTFTDPASASDERALGVMLARYFRWSGDPLIEVSAEALEDANFHDLAATVRSL